MVKKILFILMPDNFRDEEFSVPYEALVDADHSVDVAGFSEEIARGVNGYEHTPNLLVDELTNEQLKEYDALVIPGGPASSTYLWDNARIQEIIQFFYEHKKLIAAICHACVALAQAGILERKLATVYPSVDAKKIYEQYNVIFSDEGVVVLEDEAIITAQGPNFVDEFAQAIEVNL